MSGQTDVPITAGSGTNIDGSATTGTGNIRQTIVVGDPLTDANVAKVTSAQALQVDLGATTANSTAIKVDGSGVTQPVSASALPLPTGAATAAKQPALGTAGTASSDVITVQGKSGMTALSTSTTNGALETGGNLATIATNLPAQGQALAAASTPVVLPAAQITTLTPPTSITANAGTNLNTSALSTSANQTNASQKTQVVDGSGNVIASTSNALNVSANITGGSIANTSFAATQSGTWTVGTTSAAINVGQKTVNTTAVQISASSTVPTNGIIVQALSTNAASIFVGGSGVTTSTGFELVAGQAMSFSCNLNTLYIISVASTTDKICYNVE